MRYLIAVLLCWFQQWVHALTVSEAVTLDNLRYLAQQDYVDVRYTPKIVASFEAVAKTLRPDHLLMLKVVAGKRVGTANGSSIVVYESLEFGSELERQFVIAHEAGHIVLDHLAKKLALLRLYVPGDITNKDHLLRAVNSGPEMKKLSHELEFEADRFALKTLIAGGWERDFVIAAFMGLGRHPDTQSHPSTYRRIMNLRHMP